ncbi:hypothetical protein SAMN05444274_10249 [Mariniphaga anaerophila]|uniref:Uncharacterized protein n=1 Tax=Mariniphaga anaerophila TaxID=1484053 RepID=A0A1M4VBG8_9BACT|nr:hypothetical protein [Mariniphaga anaerophila]SHE66200.1 hypothetical protein SAMN05444274_10249 [Mariniphaga anaerophila]
MKYPGFLLIVLLLSWEKTAQAQSPEFYPPTVPEPVENPVLYIILAVAIIAIYAIFRRLKNKRKK